MYKKYSKIRESLKNHKLFNYPHYRVLLDTELELMHKYINDGDSVLDVGSCSGIKGFILQDVVQKKFKELYLTDYDDKWITLINSHKKLSDKNIIVKKEDVLNLSFDNERFDIIMGLGDVFTLIYKANYGGIPNNVDANHLLYDKNIFSSLAEKQGIIAIKECIRTLKTGGYLFFTGQPEILKMFKSQKTIKHTNIESILGIEICEFYSINVSQIPAANERFLICCKKLEISNDK